MLKENEAEEGNEVGGCAASEAKEEYKRQLAATMGVDNPRILAFKQKAPAPAEGHDNKLAGMYSSNTGQGPEKKKFRHVPDEPKNVLGAPDIVNDFYLNVLDWSSQNVVCYILFVHVCKSTHPHPASMDTALKGWGGVLLHVLLPCIHIQNRMHHTQ